MGKRRRHATANLPFMLAELSLASYEVIGRRTAMMLSNTCSTAEYQRMVREKTAAAMATAGLLASGNAQLGSLMAPWHSRATANVKRLRKRRT